MRLFCSLLFVLGLAASIYTSFAQDLASKPVYVGPDAPTIEDQERATSNANKDSVSAVREEQSYVGKLDKFLSDSYIGNPTQQLRPNIDIANPFVKTNGYGETQVYIQLKRLDDSAIQELESYGLKVEIQNSKFKKVQGWVTTEELDDLSQIDNVVKITTPNYSTVRKGAVNSEGDSLLKAEALQDLGYNGKGIRIGIISDGANGWQTAAASGDLPDQVTTYGVCQTGNTGQSRDLCNLTSGTCNEGTAMAEIIHEFAPEAELAVAAVNTSLEFIQQVDRLINEFKADIIVDDLGFLSEPTFYDGDIALAITEASDKVLFISSAGNSGYGHYIPEDYSRTTRAGIRTDAGTSPDTRVHDFSPLSANADPYHGFVIPPNSATTVVANWDGRITSFHSSRAFLRLRVHDIRGLAIYETPLAPLSGASEAVDGVCIPNSSNEAQVYFVTVQFYDSEAPFRLFFLGGGAIEYPTSESSIFGHAAVERVVAVGAINASVFDSKEVAFYSSRGPSVINNLQNGAGRSVILESQDIRNKPDLIAVDGISVTGTGGFPQRFFGTSAAAPHVAGIAAQLMSVSPFVDGEDARRALLAGAIDIGQNGFDNDTGYGIVSPAGALENLQYGNPIPAILLILNEDQE